MDPTNPICIDLHDLVEILWPHVLNRHIAQLDPGHVACIVEPAKLGDRLFYGLQNGPLIPDVETKREHFGFGGNFEQPIPRLRQFFSIDIA